MGKLKEFLEEFCFHNYNPIEGVIVGRDYWVDDKLKRASAHYMLLTPDKLYGYYRERREKGRAWLSVSYYEAGPGEKPRPVYFDRLLFDLDIPLPKEKCMKLYREHRSLFYRWLGLVRKETRRLYQHLSKRFNCRPVVVYTGGRGYQIHVLLNKPIGAEHYDKVFKLLLSGFHETKIPEGLLAETREVLGEVEVSSILDKQVSDPARFFRIPYTKHESFKQLGFIVDPDSFKALKLSEVNLEGRLDSSLLEKIIKLSLNIPERKKLVLSTRKKMFSLKSPLPEKIEDLARDERVPPCIRSILLQVLEVGNPDHDSRIILTLYLKWTGYSIEKVLNFYSKYFKDYNEKKCRYQVRYLYGLEGSKTNWLMYSCKKMKELGKCMQCNWNRNPVTYTYARASIKTSVKKAFFKEVNFHEK